MLKKILAALGVSLGLFFSSVAFAFASETLVLSNELMIQPVVQGVTTNIGVVGRVVNTTTAPQNLLVCGEAAGAGRRWNLGCTQVSLNASGTNPWAQDLTVYLRDDMPQGTYTVWFTYRDAAGVWHQMTNVQTHRVSKVIVVKPFVPVSGVKVAGAISLRHAFAPYVTTRTAGEPSDAVHARVDNFTARSVMVTLCAEATGMGRKWHLGCLPEKVNLNAMWSDPWALDLNVYARPGMPSGVYRVLFTYQDETGRWHEVVSLGGKPVRTVLRV